MLKKLRNRMLFFNMAIISIVMISAFAVIYVITYTNMQKENKSRLETIQTRPALGAMQESGQSDPKIVFGRIPSDYSLSLSIIVDNEGSVVDYFSFIEFSEEVYDQIAEEILNKNKYQGTITLENRKWQYQISTLRNKRLISINGKYRTIYGEGYHQIVLLDITDSSKTLTQLLITFVLVGFAMLFILFGVSFYFANRSIRPIEENWEKQKQFVADASHELKTPLAIIQANTDALLANGEETVKSQKKWINYIQSEAGRMGKLLKDMLYLAKVEDTYEDQIPLEISNTVLDVIASMEAVLFEKGINLTQTIEPYIVVKGDSERIQQAILILLDNAAKYTNKNGHVDISLKKVKNHAVFSVTNSGEGIPADKLPRIFDRFYRSDPSRSKETGGYGLGLSIAKAIIERSGGIIYVESTKNGTTFTFELRLN